MDVPEAWRTATGAGVTVGVVDSGVDDAHEDLAGRIATNAGETGAGRETNGADDDGDGKVDDARGWDFVDGDNTPQDGDGHGTHVSGTIAAANGNGAGISGVAPDAKVYPLRVLDDTGDGAWSALADAFDLAGDMGLRVVNASLGGAGDLDALFQPIFDAHPGTLYVVAAGNNGQDLDHGGLFTPCQVPSANVLCVAASDQNDERASFSNYGAASADLFAPGVNIVSTYNDGGYVAMGGTSMATPHVAGEAALLLSADPSLTTAQVKAALLAGTETRPGLAGYAGHGRANAELAVRRVADSDHDGVVDSDDACPTVAGSAAAGGCPTAAATPPPVAAAPVAPAPTTVTPPAPAGGTPVSTTPVASAPLAAPPAATLPAVKVRASGRRVTLREAAVPGVALTVRVARKVCRGGRCTWRTVSSASGRAGRAVAVSRTLAAGTYRATVAGAGCRPRATTFTVRR
jgi:subtilisin family serine protease